MQSMNQRIYKKNNYGSFPPMMWEGFETIEKLFCNHIDGVDNDMISDLFNFSDLECKQTAKREKCKYKRLKICKIILPQKGTIQEVQDYIHDRVCR